MNPALKPADYRETDDTAEITQNFYIQVIFNYLNRELSGYNWRIKPQRSSYTLTWQKGSKSCSSLQLRFDRRTCLWALFKRGRFNPQAPHSWQRHEPDRRCLSLNDWLTQIRKLLTGKIS
ncbi:hypothetical protein IJT93_12680 [bacterium]|nr:hypothetical protein [bacterium]